MKKVLYTLAALSFVFVACNKQEIVPEEGTSQEGELTTVTIKASNGDADTKAAISDGLAFTWTTGDKIAVHTDAGLFYESEGLDSGGITADFTVSLSGNRNGYAVYPASVAKSWDGTNLTLTLPGTYTYTQVSGENTPLPMIAANISEALSFYHVTGLLRLTITNIPTDTNKIKLDFNGKKVSGDFPISSPTAGISTIAAASGTKGTDDIIWITDITGTADLTVNIPLPTGATYSDLIVSAWNGDVALKGHVEAFSYSAKRAYGKKLSVALDLGTFSIADGKYAVFSPGNLVATIGADLASTSWAFHEHQYDMVYSTYDPEKPFDGANQKTNYQSFETGQKIDLFGWVGTNSGFTGKAMYGITDITDNAQYGSSTTDALKDDWGNLSISGYAAGTWYTPSLGKWKWLIGTDPDKGTDKSEPDPGTNCRESSTVSGVENARFAKMMVNGVVGLMVFPDNYVHPEGVDAINHINSHATHWEENTNEYSESDWNKMEQAGAVFLPSAMTRSSKDGHANYIDWGRTGYYWTSTPNYGAMCVRFSDGIVQPDLKNDRSQGKNVRLVRDLN